MRKTKIICTLGPSTDDPAVLRRLVESGMDVARFNFSHGSHEEQQGRLDMLRAIAAECGRPVAALMDTKGPEIRLGMFAEEKVWLRAGESFVLTAEECTGDEHRAQVSYPGLVKDVRKGDHILLDDGKISLLVNAVRDREILCTVENDGPISSRKGVNVPGVELSMPYISRKDYDDLIFCAKAGFDYVAASFVRTADDVKEVRMLLNWNGGEKIRIIAKIENLQGVKNIDSILEVADGIMVARGDMGVELPLEEVPIAQKKIIGKVYRRGKPVITATQMLDSMMHYPRPTRAETNDVANAIYDGTSAIMLSGETAAGKYPVEALQTMVRIAESAEGDIDYHHIFQSTEFSSGGNVTHAISHAACTSAMDLDAAAVLVFTLTGRAALDVSAYRPGCPIIACTTQAQVCRQLNLSWGVKPLIVTDVEDIDLLIAEGAKRAVEQGLVKPGDTLVITAGLPVGVTGTTNFIRVIKA